MEYSDDSPFNRAIKKLAGSMQLGEILTSNIAPQNVGLGTGNINSQNSQLAKYLQKAKREQMFGDEEDELMFADAPDERVLQAIRGRNDVEKEAIRRELLRKHLNEGANVGRQEAAALIKANIAKKASFASEIADNKSESAISLKSDASSFPEGDQPLKVYNPTTNKLAMRILGKYRNTNFEQREMEKAIRKMQAYMGIDKILKPTPQEEETKSEIPQEPQPILSKDDQATIKTEASNNPVAAAIINSTEKEQIQKNAAQQATTQQQDKPKNPNNESTEGSESDESSDDEGPFKKRKLNNAMPYVSSTSRYNFQKQPLQLEADIQRLITNQTVFQRIAHLLGADQINEIARMSYISSLAAFLIQSCDQSTSKLNSLIAILNRFKSASSISLETVGNLISNLISTGSRLIYSQAASSQAANEMINAIFAGTSGNLNLRLDLLIRLMGFMGFNLDICVEILFAIFNHMGGEDENITDSAKMTIISQIFKLLKNPASQKINGYSGMITKIMQEFSSRINSRINANVQLTSTGDVAFVTKDPTEEEMPVEGDSFLTNAETNVAS